MTVFLDGTGITPGTEGCKCGPHCEMPCWMRIGIAPACRYCGCPEFSNDEADDESIDLTEGSHA